jgi:hypothetical protein
MNDIASRANPVFVMYQWRECKLRKGKQNHIKFGGINNVHRNWNSGSATGLENREYGRGGLLCWLHDTLYPQELALISPTSGGRFVSIVRSRPKAIYLSLLVQWLSLALSKRPNRVSPSPHLKTETDPFPKRCFVVIQNSGRWTKSTNPMILSIIHQHRNPFDSKLWRLHHVTISPASSTPPPQSSNCSPCSVLEHQEPLCVA